jgi:hypothetical protein
LLNLLLELLNLCRCISYQHPSLGPTHIPGGTTLGCFGRIVTVYSSRITASQTCGRMICSSGPTRL